MGTILKIFFNLILIVFGFPAWSEGVIAYIPTTLPMSKIEKKIKSSAENSVPVTAFAKFSDFELGLESIKPTYIISTNAFTVSDDSFESLGGLKIDGENKSTFILVGLTPDWKKKDISKLRIGSVEFIKRSKIKDYLETVFQQKFKSIKTVSKPADLYPLLVFDSVDLVAIETYLYKELKGKFNTVVFEIKTSQEVQSISLFQRKGAGSEKIAKKLKTFDYSSIGADKND